MPRACGCGSSAGAAAPVPPALIERMQWAESVTERNERITLFVAFNYGGRAEIVDAARTFTGGDEEEFRKHLYAPDMHDPDLIIRTSGEQTHLELPDVAVGLLGVRVPRRAVARFHARGVRREPRRVCGPQAPLRRSLMPC